MSPIRESVEIARRAEDVFAYLDDLARHGEWQEQIVSAHVETEGPTRVGTRVTERRRMGRREEDTSYEVVAHDPPRSFSFQGLGGSIRVAGTGRVEPIGDGPRARVSLELDFTGHGVGKLLLPLVRSQARKQVPRDQQRLKERLESDAA